MQWSFFLTQRWTQRKTSYKHMNSNNDTPAITECPDRATWIREQKVCLFDRIWKGKASRAPDGITWEKNHKYIHKKSQVCQTILVISRFLCHHTCDYYLRYFRLYLCFSFKTYFWYFFLKYTCDLHRKYVSQNHKYGVQKRPNVYISQVCHMWNSQVCQV